METTPIFLAFRTVQYTKRDHHWLAYALLVEIRVEFGVETTDLF